MNKKQGTILIIILIILTGIGIVLYTPWFKECKYVNQNYKCGIYDCSIVGYFTNHNFCF